MPSWSGKTRGGKTGYRIFALSIKHLGLPFAYFILKLVVVYFFVFSPKSVRTSFHYFHNIFKYGTFKSILKIFNNYYIFGQTLIDRLALMAGYKTKLTFDFDGEDHLRKMADNKTGGLLISAHIGNFEIAGHLLKRLNVKVNLLMLNAEHQRIKEFQENVFKDIGVNIITIQNDYSHIFEIKKACENKEIVCMLGDRFMEGSKTLAAKFLNDDAMFPTGPFYMAMKYNVPVSFVFGMKEKKISLPLLCWQAKKLFSASAEFKKKGSVHLSYYSRLHIRV
ncbi:MAG: lipid A biosynthesis acyltransferase [Bacteroidota bacterium]